MTSTCTAAAKASMKNRRRPFGLTWLNIADDFHYSTRMSELIFYRFQESNGSLFRRTHLTIWAQTPRLSWKTPMRWLRRETGCRGACSRMGANAVFLWPWHWPPGGWGQGSRVRRAVAW